MAITTGREGLVKIGSDTVGELKSWTLDEGTTLIDRTTIGDTSEKHTVGANNWKGSFECFWDNADSAQAAITSGASVTLSFYPEGADTGDKYKSGTATCESISSSSSVGELVGASYSFTGNGDLTETTI